MSEIHRRGIDVRELDTVLAEDFEFEGEMDVYMVSYVMDAALLVRQAKELDLNPNLFIGGAAGFTLPEFQKNAGDASEFVYSATLWVDSVPYAGAQDYAKKYQAKYKG